MFRIRGMGAVIGAMFLASSSSNAVAAAVNAEASVSTISPCPSFCGGFGGAFDEDFQGGPGVDSASSNLNNSDGNGTAQAELNGPTQLPVLRADAQSHATAPAQRSSMVQAVGTAMRHYIYNGPSTNVDLNLSLHGRATAVNPSDALLQAQVLAYRGPDLDNFSASFDALFFEIIPLTPGLSLLDQKSLTVPTNAGVQTVNGTLSLSLDDGDSFFVWGQIIASGTRGGSANGLDTLTLQFGDPTGITPVGPVAVPLPGAGLLQGGALMVLAWRRRRRRV